MWWHRPLLAALAVTAVVGLAGCGIQPLYGTTAGGSRLAAAMASVDVTPIPGRVGQRVRNELIFENTGGSGQAASAYKLDIVIKESVINELVKISGDAKGQVYELDATFKLISNDGRVLLEGKATSRASRPSSPMCAPATTQRTARPAPSPKASRSASPPISRRQPSRVSSTASSPWSPTRPDRFSAS
jgi:LPS-assembly lipoprotein